MRAPIGSGVPWGGESAAMETPSSEEGIPVGHRILRLPPAVPTKPRRVSTASCKGTRDERVSSNGDQQSLPMFIPSPSTSARKPIGDAASGGVAAAEQESATPDSQRPGDKIVRGDATPAAEIGNGESAETAATTLTAVAMYAARRPLIVQEHRKGALSSGAPPALVLGDTECEAVGEVSSKAEDLGKAESEIKSLEKTGAKMDIETNETNADANAKAAVESDIKGSSGTNETDGNEKADSEANEKVPEEINTEAVIGPDVETFSDEKAPTDVNAKPTIQSVTGTSSESDVLSPGEPDRTSKVNEDKCNETTAEFVAKANSVTVDRANGELKGVAASTPDVGRGARVQRCTGRAAQLIQEAMEEEELSVARNRQEDALQTGEAGETQDARVQRLSEALHAAVAAGDAVAAKRLLVAGADPDIPDWRSRGEAPLLRASSRGDAACVRALLEGGCDPNARTAQGETALHLAASRRRAPRRSAGPGAGPGRCQREERDSEAAGEEARRAAALALDLIAAGCDPRLQCSLQGCTALHVACRRLGAWPEGDASAEEQLLRTLAAGGAARVRDHRLRSPMHRLVEAGVTHPAFYQLLLESDADASAQDARGETPLLAALQRCGGEGSGSPASSGGGDEAPMAAVVRLLALRTRLDAADAYGETALHVAARTDQPAIAALLLQNGAPAEARDLRGNTPLHLAAGRGFARVVAQLLAVAPSAAAAANADGCTPLHVAVDSGFVHVVKLLLEVKECNLHARTELGQTPLDLAQEEYRRRSTPQMALILLQAIHKREAHYSL